VAKEESADPWAERGGLLDPIPAGTSGSIFADEAGKLKNPGELSPVFETSDRQHILRLEEIKPAVVPEFDKVQDVYGGVCSMSFAPKICRHSSVSYASGRLCESSFSSLRRIRSNSRFRSSLSLS